MRRHTNNPWDNNGVRTVALLLDGTPIGDGPTYIAPNGRLYYLDSAGREVIVEPGQYLLDDFDDFDGYDRWTSFPDFTEPTAK